MSDMKIQRLGDCMYWSSALDKSPQFVIANFELSLLELKNILKRIEQSHHIQAILNHYLHSKNSNNCSPFALYDKDEDITMVFSPVSSLNLKWSNWNLRKVESDFEGNIPENYFENELMRLRIHLELLACTDKQILLNEKLVEWQKQLKSKKQKWVHFSDRMEMFWKCAAEVCLKNSAPIMPYSAEEKEILDGIFLANKDNRISFLEYLYAIYETNGKLSTQITNLVKKINKLYSEFSKPNVKLNDDFWTRITIAQQEIGRNWAAIWSENDSKRAELERYPTDEFAREMRILETYILEIMKIRNDGNVDLKNCLQIVENALKQTNLVQGKWNKIMREVSTNNQSGKKRN